MTLTVNHTLTPSNPSPVDTRPGPAAAAPGAAPSTPSPVDVRKAALLRFAISISALTVVGHLLLGFEQAPLVPIVGVLVAYAVSIAIERLDTWARGTAPAYAGGRLEVFYFLLPAHIAALACSMLIYGQSLGIYLFAVVVAVGSKYVFRIRVRERLRHFLNPSNFGISVTLLAMPAVGFVPPYMFLNATGRTLDWVIPVVVLLAGTMLNAKLTRRMPLIAAWVGGFVAQAIIRAVVLDDQVWSSLGAMTGVAFILFTNYMITDPGTTPIAPRRQVVFGLSTAAVYGLLISFGVAYAIFFALIVVCALRGAVMWSAERRRIRAEARPMVAAS